MSDRRPLSRPLLGALWAGVLVCACDGTARAADPASSRSYPPTYASRKAPWYDPFRWFTDEPKSAAAPDSKITPTHFKQSTPPAGPSWPTPFVSGPGPVISSPSWKWYGYGTPTPGANPLAPAGNYAPVPGTWYNSVGATPGAQPGLHEQPSLDLSTNPLPPPKTRPSIAGPVMIVPPTPGPALPGVAAPPASFASTDLESTSPAARLRSPALPANDIPKASLRAPVRGDDTPATRQPAVEFVAPHHTSNAPDLPVVPAPGIVVPGK